MIHNFITQALEKEAEVHRNTKKKRSGVLPFPTSVMQTKRYVM